MLINHGVITKPLVFSLISAQNTLPIPKTKWFGKFVDQEELDLDVRADTATINLGILESRPVLDKTITFKGLNLDRGIRLEHLQLVLPPVNGYNVKGMLMIPNKSPIAFGIGDYTLDVFAAGVNVDYITIKDTVLNPGYNLQALDGFVDLRVLAGQHGRRRQEHGSIARGRHDGSDSNGGGECYINGQRLTLIENVVNHRSLTIHGSVATLLADLVGGLLMPQLDTDHGTNRGSSFIDAISTVFSNQTLMGNIADYWNKTKKRSEGGTQ
ncbi:hypothetical protein MY3296_001412 [Beauveria thailandica]